MREGIDYISIPALGNLFLNDQDWKERYRQLLHLAGDLLLEPLWSLAGPVCLLCAEKRAADCHRAIIADDLIRRGWSIEHIE